MSIESPCVKRCELDSRQRHCLGCARSLQEIADWSRYSASQRRHIMQALPARLAAIQKTHPKDR